MTIHRHPFPILDALDRPIWSSLTSQQRSLALGGRLARRYPAEIAPFAALSEFTPAAVSELRDLAAHGPIALLGSAPLDPLAGLEVGYTALLRQMVLVQGGPQTPAIVPDILGTKDLPAMLELTSLTKPGPFFPKTHLLGRYIGIRDDDRLAAMAGERMRLDGFTEISAVCVHPDYRGKGYARSLVLSLMAMILEGGDTPFLHVLDSNTGAIALYERLGFATRRSFHLAVLQGAGSPA